MNVRNIIEIRASPERVFAHMDDMANVGWHMEGERAMPLMGGTLHHELLSENVTGLGATYRWYGKVMGMSIDFEETVTRWVKNKEKVWKTVGDAKIIVMSKYEMRLNLVPIEDGTRVTFEIDYELPSSFLGKILGKLLARRYAHWCLRRACEDTRRVLESEQSIMHSVHRRM